MDLAAQPSPQMLLLQHPIWLSQGRSHLAADRTPFLVLPEYRLGRLLSVLQWYRGTAR